MESEHRPPKTLLMQQDVCRKVSGSDKAIVSNRRLRFHDSQETDLGQVRVALLSIVFEF
jgi:hypothetical protein